MTGFEAFTLYHAIKLHFSSSYDYFKYNGKTNLKQENFEKRRDKYYFLKISRKYKDKESLMGFLVANFLENNKIWIGELLSEDCVDIYLRRQKIIQTISYVFENECNFLLEQEDNPNNIIKTDGDYPYLLKAYLTKDINLETVCILNMILKFLPMWDRKISDTIIWPKYKMMIEKYSYFIPDNMEKYKSILKRIVKK